MFDEIDAEVKDKQHWVRNAKPGDKITYALGLCLSDTKLNNKIGQLFWRFHKENLVHLFQIKHKHGGENSYFEYIAVRKSTPIKESWNI